ncbi:MOSC domain-containing protein [Ruegeria sp. B32]|uniref:MOSC domain-containing protein n=1 Tax=Ruegeria sp. B32 TaxID=2867020 RepID=UPI0021A7C7D2|nr:MOSC domain-containing protein [Ruegeria sp. B32]UWR06636.1 MOSC domain-containing protein [Ruegeria sp. B32]
MNTLSIVRLNRYPIKGLSAEPMQTVTLRAGEGIPGDRLFGFARYNSGFDPQNPQPLPKDRFVVLLNEAALAGVETSFDFETQDLEIKANGKTQSFNMRTPEDRMNAASFLSSEIGLKDPELPEFVSSAPHRFTDVSVVSPKMMNAISVLNRASVRELGEKLNAEIQPARFRANIEIDGLPALFELEAVGSVLRFGDVELKILSRTKRCAATEVNPDTAERDLKIPYLIRKLMGHMDMGIYVEVTKGGTLSVGQPGEMLA